MDFGMTFETESDCIAGSIAGRRGGRLDMVDFDLHAAEAVTDAAAPMTGDKERFDVLGTKLVPALTARGDFGCAP
jgi:hypothetical protein